MIPPPDLLIYLRPLVTLTFDLLTPKVDHFMPFLRGPVVPICIKIGSFILKYHVHYYYGNGRKDNLRTCLRRPVCPARVIKIVKSVFSSISEVNEILRNGFCRATCYALARLMPSCSVCLSRLCILSKRVNQVFLLVATKYMNVGQPHYSSFSTPNLIAIFPSGGVECRGDMQNSRSSTNILIQDRAIVIMERQ